MGSDATLREESLYPIPPWWVGRGPAWTVQGVHGMIASQGRVYSHQTCAVVSSASTGRCRRGRMLWLVLRSTTSSPTSSWSSTSSLGRDVSLVVGPVWAFLWFWSRSRLGRAPSRFLVVAGPPGPLGFSAVLSLVLFVVAPAFGRRVCLRFVVGLGCSEHSLRGRPVLQGFAHCFDGPADFAAFWELRGARWRDLRHVVLGICRM